MMRRRHLFRRVGTGLLSRVYQQRHKPIDHVITW